MIKENSENSRTSNDIDMKPAPVSMLTRETNDNDNDNDVMSENCDAIIIFSIYGQFRAIWKPDSRQLIADLHLF